jgi:hypothetical protein
MNRVMSSVHRVSNVFVPLPGFVAHWGVCYEVKKEMRHESRLRPTHTAQPHKGSVGFGATYFFQGLVSDILSVQLTSTQWRAGQPVAERLSDRFRTVKTEHMSGSARNHRAAPP